MKTGFAFVVLGGKNGKDKNGEESSLCGQDWQPYLGGRGFAVFIVSFNLSPVDSVSCKHSSLGMSGKSVHLFGMLQLFQVTRQNNCLSLTKIILFF